MLPAQRVLVLAPHPDDEVFGCGGAILRHVAEGVPVHVRIWTRGGYGAPPGQQNEYVAARQRESTAAAALLGYGTPEFGSGEDRNVVYGERLVQEVLDLIEASGADLVYAPSVLEMHPDHRVLAMAAVEAVRRRGKNTRLAQYEIGMPLRPNLLLDITDVAARKMEAMQCFASQLLKQRYDLDVAALNRYRSWTLPPEVTAAEAYLVTSAEELQQDPLGLYRSEYEKQAALGLPLDSRDMPLVSVIIRSMDRASLALALDSVALQTWRNVEVVIVNATGREHRALGEWCGRFPLRIVNPGRPLQRSPAANCGLDAARGDFLIFLDDDDLFLPHHIAKLCEELLGDDQVVAAYAGVIGTDRSGAEVRRFSGAFDSTRLRIENYIPIHALLFRPTALAAGARFDEALPVCEDWDVWLQLLAQGDFRHVPEMGAVYNMESSEGSGVWVNHDETHRVVIELYRKWFPRWGDSALLGLVHYAHSRFELDELWQKLAQLEQKARDDVSTLEAYLSTKDNIIAARDEHVTKLKEWVDKQDEYITALKGSLNDQITAIADREKQITALVNSTSWRLTAPLRRAMDMLGRKPVEVPPAPPIPARPEMEAAVAHALAMPSVTEVSPPESETRAPEKHNYDYAVDPEAKCAPNFVCELVGAGKRVLEIGCGPGSITRLMKARGQCRVTGIEVDSSAIEIARPHCEAIYQQDLNAEKWPQVLGKTEPFDVVVAADVLEHLYDPWRTLRQMASLISFDGAIVVSLPHSGHAAFLGALASNDVAYGDLGLLDRTHIRFFGLKNVEALFAQARLKIIDVRFVILTPEETELAAQWHQLPEFVRAALRLSRYANIYQVVVKAVPLGRPGTPLSLLDPN